MRAVALVLEWSVPACEAGQRREDVGELGTNVAVQEVEESRVEATHVVIEGVDEHPERKVSFELGGGT